MFARTPGKWLTQIVMVLYCLGCLWAYVAVFASTLAKVIFLFFVKDGTVVCRRADGWRMWKVGVCACVRNGRRCRSIDVVAVIAVEVLRGCVHVGVRSSGGGWVGEHAFWIVVWVEAVKLRLPLRFRHGFKRHLRCELTIFLPLSSVFPSPFTHFSAPLRLIPQCDVYERGGLVLWSPCHLTYLACIIGFGIAVMTLELFEIAKVSLAS